VTRYLADDADNWRDSGENLTVNLFLAEDTADMFTVEAESLPEAAQKACVALGFNEWTGIHAIIILFDTEAKTLHRMRQIRAWTVIG
jgi:hypothetical protein